MGGVAVVRVLLCLAWWLPLATFASAESPAGRPTVAVWLVNHDEALANDIGRAQAVVEGLFRRAGLRIEWVRDTRARAGTVLTVVIEETSSQGDRAAETADVLGSASLSRDGGRSTLARVFGRRLRRFAEMQRLHLSSLLGGVIAHELGHLLLPLNAHASAGLMQAVWHPRGLPPHAPGVPNFLPEQAHLMQQRARGLDAGTVQPAQLARWQGPRLREE